MLSGCNSDIWSWKFISSSDRYLCSIQRQELEPLKENCALSFNYNLAFSSIKRVENKASDVWQYWWVSTKKNHNIFSLHMIVIKIFWNIDVNYEFESMVISKLIVK